MKKCKSCVWSDKVDKNHIFCMFSKCIRKSRNINESDKGRKDI
ncbi:hypothetical protein [Clostridium sp. JS66]|nr:hypothetical protein [Clostridium sp. JS66]WPC42764.1 hypothetical protein Q6H37_04650 [Clostridium sp. JS66]